MIPEKIRAEDQDTLRTEVEYSFIEGSPPFYRDHFAINPKTGVVKQTQAVERTSASLFNITVKVGKKYFTLLG